MKGRRFYEQIKNYVGLEIPSIVLTVCMEVVKRRRKNSEKQPCFSN